MDANTSISVCTPDEWAHALWLLHQDLDETARVAQVTQLMMQAKETPTFFAGLYVAHSAATLQGSIWAQEMPGDMGVLWLPRLASGASMEVARALVDETQSFWNSKRTCLVQAVIQHPNTADAKLVEDAGFTQLTILDYMACETAVTQAPPLSGQFNITPYQAPQRDELTALVEATYVETLDCPEMDNVRPLDEVMAGYEATGTSGTTHWFVGRDASQPVACLLLADHGNGDFELVYVGVTLPARGRQLGELLTAFALSVAKRNAAQRLLLAVDTRNHPAIRIYEKLGFEQLCRREVWMWRRESVT